MGQGECLKILEENGDWMSVKEIQKKMSISRWSVLVNLNRLVKGNFIQKKFVKEVFGNRTSYYSINMYKAIPDGD